MDFLCRLEKVFGHFVHPSAKELKESIDSLDVNLKDLLPYIEEPGDYPYGRKLLYKSKYLEILVMNWAYNKVCAPHDHGSSFGWVKVVSGESTNISYKLDKDEVPTLSTTWTQRAESIFFAPKGQVHAMQNLCSEPLVTFHVYAPPISGMKVYDLKRCAACIVSDDCGAWWPDDRLKLLQELKLRSPQKI
jgi:cysteine dioxygenase